MTTNEIENEKSGPSNAKSEQLTPFSPAREPSLAIRLGWVSFFNDCSSEVLARALPLFLTAGLGATPTFVGLIEGAAEAVSILLKGFSGWLSDRMPSRKPLVVFGYSCSVASRVALLGAGVPLLLGLSRVFDRTGKGLRSAPRDAMIADGAAAGKSGRAFGITRFLDSLGAVTGLLIALLLGLGRDGMTRDSFHQIVLISLVPATLSIIAVVVFVPRITRVTTAKRYLSLHVPRNVRGYLAIVAVFALGNSSDAFLVLRASQLGYSFPAILGLFAAFNILAALLAVPVGRLSDRFGRVRFLAFGWTVYAMAYAGFATVGTATGFAITLLVYGAFYGFTEGVEKALLADLLPATERGTGFGAMQLVLGLAALPASLLTGYLLTSYGAGAAFGTAAGFAGFGTVALMLWARRRHLVQ